MTVKFFARAREIVGVREEAVDVKDTSTVLDVLKVLVKKHGANLNEYIFEPNSNNPHKYIRFLLNGRSASTSDQVQVPAGESVLAIVPPTAGG